MKPELDLLTKFIYTFHMPIFLIISGYFYKSSSRPQQIFTRIALPYILFISLYLISLYVVVNHLGLSTRNAPPTSLNDFLKTIIISPYGAYWFLHSLIIIQLVFSILSMVIGKFLINEDTSYIYTILFSYTLLIYMSELSFIKLRVINFFIVGLLLNKISSQKLSCQKYFSVIAFVCISLVIHFTELSIYDKSSMIELLWCLSLMFTMWSFFQNINESIIFRFICWLGKNSLLILVIHAGIIVGMKPLNKLFIQFDSSGLLQVFVVSAITLVGSVLSGKLFDRINISKFIFGTKTIYRSFTK